MARTEPDPAADARDAAMPRPADAADATERRLAEVRAGFDAREDYDDFVRMCLPGYEEMLDAIETLVAGHRPEPTNVLDLGIGTAAVAERVLTRLPSARLVGVDFSVAMLQRAKVRLAADESRIALVEGDLRDFRLPAGAANGGSGEGPRIDAAVSCLAVHHLDAGDKRALFSRLADMLPPGGLFVLGDVVELPPRIAERVRSWRLEHIRNACADGGVDPETILRREHDTDRPSSLADQVDWLRESGFSEVASVWEMFGTAVVAAIR